MSEMTLHGKLFLGPYQGYHGEASFDPEDECFSGRVVDTKDIITFEGDTPWELKQAFVESINDYLEFCRERGDAPEKPFSGKFNVRITPELHHDLSILAAQANQSLNQYVADALANYVRSPKGMSIAVTTGVPIPFTSGTMFSPKQFHQFAVDSDAITAWLSGTPLGQSLRQIEGMEDPGVFTTKPIKAQNVSFLGGRLSDVPIELPSVRRTGTTG